MRFRCLPAPRLARPGSKSHRRRSKGRIGESTFLNTEVQRDLRRDASKSEAKRLTKAEKRAEREAELAAKIIALPKKRYGVIVADPEWRFGDWAQIAN